MAKTLSNIMTANDSSHILNNLSKKGLGKILKQKFQDLRDLFLTNNIEDYEDIREAKKARAEYERNPEMAISHKKVIKQLNLKKKNTNK